MSKAATITSEVAATVCHEWEELNGMTSEEFLERYAAGEFIGVKDAVRWVSMIDTRDRLAGEATAEMAAPRQLVDA